jgi:acyl-CoA dehydrogenase
MDFDIPEELKMVQSLVRDFVDQQLKPLERDILGRAADLNDARASLPSEIEEKLIGMVKDMGLWGISVPQELGGAGLSALGNCLVEEELAKTVIPFNFGDVTPLLFDCNDRQKEKYLLPVLHKQRQAYLALMEPEKGGDLSTIGTRAEKVNGHYVLSGRKLSLSKAGKDYFALVFATTAEKRTKEGVTCFLVDKDTPGFSVTDGEEKIGWQAHKRQPIFLVFDHCRLPAESILGEEGRAFYLGKEWLPSRRLIRGARCIGIAQRLLEEATTRVQTWQSFGQLMSRRTSIEAALADIVMSIHACRLMVYEASWKADKGESIRRETAMVKLFATKMIYDIADRVSHVFDAPPYVAGLPMERLCRHAITTSATEVALQLQRSIIAKDVLKGLKPG